MALERRRQLLLAALGVALAAGLMVYRVWPGTTATVPSASNPRAQGRAATGPASMTAPDVHLDALRAERPKPDEADRDVFRFKPKQAPPKPQASPTPPTQTTPVRPGPAPPPSVPPITLKFVALMEQNGQKIVSLRDDRGITTAREGEIILGRYKIWHIGEESVEVSYLDGTGRTTIRLNGQ